MSEKLKIAKAAFPHTIPIMTSFLLIGMAYGIFANGKGLAFWYPGLMSIAIFAGSMEFVAVNLLVGRFDPLGALLMALMVNARYFFYGISMLERYRGLGKKKLYMVYAMCDETFSLHCAVEPPAGMDKGKFMLAISILDQCYWVIGSFLGGIVGSLLSFDARGIDFILTALYIVIFLDQWLCTKSHTPAVTGLLASVTCLLIFGAENFVLPAMACILLVLLLAKQKLQKGKAGDGA